MTTATTAAPTIATLPNQVTATARLQAVLRLIVRGLTPMLGGYWVVMVLTFAVAGTVVKIVTGGDTSIWDYGTQSPKYFSAAVGITFVPAFFGLLIAHGVTRRMVAVAAAIFFTGAAACTAVLWVLMYQLEHVVYSWQDWSQTLPNAHLFSRPTQSGLVFTEFFLLVIAHEAAGWLIGICFYRFGVWKGILLLPLCILPAVTAELVLAAQWFANEIAGTGYQRPPLAIGAPLVLVVSALGLWAGYLLIRSLGLKPAKG
ncbi:hypothetical protein FB561_0242 [Kribbella amoyensis]|uniref:Uncharacterized protein n=1 Tax=Kribbella amoyensis TaxID=996641 RepID=A0A561BJY5_9ACTN|nr:hypothetical protein [Kribbella amoyensis]TWD79187.1 hypothetical protein FB561_0242 [Kribbella amoyensis]